jgi:hypothetical protein
VDVDLDPHRTGGDAVEGEGSGRREHAEDARRLQRTCYEGFVSMLELLARHTRDPAS